MHINKFSLSGWSALVVVLFAVTFPGGRLHAASVDVTTTAMLGGGDRADDPVIWENKSDPSNSIVLGVNKSSDGVNGGVYAFALDGSRATNSSAWQEGVNLFEKGEQYNNIDMREGFQAGSTTWEIVCASNRQDREIDVFRVKKNASGDFNGLEHVGEIPIGTGFAPGTDAPYGLGMYREQDDGVVYALISDKEGRVAQYSLEYNPTGSGDNQVTGTRVTNVIDVSLDGSEVEGIVGDDENRVIYIAAENRGIYRYSLNDKGVLQNSRVTVAEPLNNDELTADLEGLTIYSTINSTRYLISSVQGRSQYAIFEREFSDNSPNRYLKNVSISGVENTDGLHASSTNFGGQFQSGMLAVHDGLGETPTRYKYVIGMISLMM